MILLNIVLALYPILFFTFLVYLKVPVRSYSLVTIIFAVAVVFFYIFKGLSKKNNEKLHGSNLWNPLLLLAIGIVCFITNNKELFKFSPVFINISLLYTFGITLFRPPSMIYRFAILMDKTIPKSIGEKKITTYCYKVTIVWVIFFAISGCIAALIAFFGSDLHWVIYNTVGSGILTGTIFCSEFFIRRLIHKKIPQAIPLSSFNVKSRIPSRVMCYEGAWNDGVYKTWNDFLKETAVLRKTIETAGGNKWLLYSEDYWYFLVSFTALLQCKKEIILSANVSPSYIAEIKEDANFITDHVFPENNIYGKTYHIPSILSENFHENALDKNNKIPKITKDETTIVLFTSGSTGKPKKINQRLTELENDNAFILSMWGEEIINRKICSTVNQHHIYGLLFSILLPFTAGIPFRRQIIRFPEEYQKLEDTEYTIITVPAFLKRGTEVLKPNELNLKNPYIFVSSGVLTPEVAEKTNEIFGFWPIEIYGSTETSGIAWRQSKNGIEWTPFENAQISQNEKNCLVIRSPYIKDPAGFETADTAEILEDGRFILKERIDSLVKIEGKRISLTEMEARILQSGLASEAFVIPMESTRQYLAAIVILNDTGKEKFNNDKKNDINKFFRNFLYNYFEHVVIPKKWRYPKVMPDIHGKKKIEELRLLFKENN